MVDRPWYFRDGTPINPETIRKIVKAARFESQEKIDRRKIQGRRSNDNLQILVDYATKRFSKWLWDLIQAEFDAFHARPIKLTGNPKLDRTRAWRRHYQRRYQMRLRAQLKMLV